MGGKGSSPVHGPGGSASLSRGREWGWRTGEELRELAYTGTAMPERRITPHSRLPFLLHRAVGEERKDASEVHLKFQVWMIK